VGRGESIHAMAEGHTLLEGNLEKITQEEADCKLAGCSVSVCKPQWRSCQQRAVQPCCQRDAVENSPDVRR